MDIDKIEVKKIIEQEITPNESVIVWSDHYIKSLKLTLDEQVALGVDPEVAKSRLLTYVSDRINSELRTDIY